MKVVDDKKVEDQKEKTKEEILKEELDSQKTEGELLVEKWNPILNSEKFTKIDKKLELPVARVMENIEENKDILVEDFTSTGELQFFKDRITPVFRESVTKTRLLEVVGFQPIPQKKATFWVERFYYGGNDTLPAGPLLSTTDRGTADPDFLSYVIRVEMSESQYNAIDLTAPAYIKAAGGAGANIAKILFKETTNGGAKLLVRLESGQSMLPVGTIYVTGPNVDLNMSHVWNNELGRSVHLRSYGEFTEADGEALNDWPSIKMSLETVDVTAISHKLLFELSQETISDLAKLTGDDAQKRLVGAVNWQLAMAVNRKLFNLMTSNALISTAWAFATADGRHEDEKFKALRRNIKYEQNRIGIRTQKGRANYAVVTSTPMAVIETLPGFMAEMADEGGDQAGIIKVGKLDGIMYYMNTMTGEAGDFMILGYKGSEQHDAGVFYCPYIPLIVSHANDFKNPERRRTSFSQRAAFEPHPQGADRFITYFDINLTGSSMQ